MKMISIFHVFTIWLVTSSLFINTLVSAVSEEYEAELEKYANLTEVVSGGFNSGSRVLIELVSGFYSVAVQTYPVGVEGGGDKELLNGLWYWDIGYEKMKHFDKYLEDLKSK
jgi:hypothetical protein